MIEASADYVERIIWNGEPLQLVEAFVRETAAIQHAPGSEEAG